jgi:hypothetical protein
MRKLTTYMGTLLLLVASQTLLAQHSGHSMGGMSSGSYGHDTSAMKDMQQMMAVQATGEQTIQFHSWSQSTDLVKQRLEELRRAVETSNYSSQLDAFKAAVEKGSIGHQEFVSGLSQAQQAGLKKPLKRLGKRNDELTKAVATAVQELGLANSGRNRAAKLVKVQKAVDKLLRDQKGIATEMSIQA